jgi:hypothetical protein
VGWLPRQFGIDQFDCVQVADGQPVDEGLGQQGHAHAGRGHRHQPVPLAALRGDLRLEAGFGEGAQRGSWRNRLSAAPAASSPATSV